MIIGRTGRATRYSPSRVRHGSRFPAGNEGPSCGLQRESDTRRRCMPPPGRCGRPPRARFLRRSSCSRPWETEACSACSPAAFRRGGKRACPRPGRRRGCRDRRCERQRGAGGRPRRGAGVQRTPGSGGGRRGRSPAEPGPRRTGAVRGAGRRAQRLVFARATPRPGHPRVHGAAVRAGFRRRARPRRRAGRRLRPGHRRQAPIRPAVTSPSLPAGSTRTAAKGAGYSPTNSRTSSSSRAGGPPGGPPVPARRPPPLSGGRPTELPSPRPRGTA